jgi:hypothetical protein
VRTRFLPRYLRLLATSCNSSALVTQGGRSPTGVTSPASARSTGDRADW